MNKVKKIVISFGAVILISASVTPTMVSYAASPVNLFDTDVSAVSVNPRADIIDWRYKTVGNEVFRRKYNYSKRKWIGEWELCGYV